MVFRKFFINVYNLMNEKSAKNEKHLSDLGYFVIVTFPVFYFVNKFIVGINGYESFFLRASIGVLGLLLVLRNYFPLFLKKMIPFVFYGFLIYAFPFFFFFMLFQNPDSIIWMVNVLCGLFFLSFFLNWKEYIAFSIVGFLLAFLVFCAVTPNPHLPANFIGLAITYTNPVVYLAVFSDKKDHILQEKLNTMKMLAGTIAHELRTPLSAMVMGAKNLARLLPAYQAAYEQAKEAHLPIPSLTLNQEKYLEALPQTFQTVSQNAHTMITMLLTNLSEGVMGQKAEKCSMRQCVEEALQAYPFSANERRLVHWEDQETTNTPLPDFVFLGHKEMTKHVLFNLLKNALYAIAAAGKGEIHISIELGDKFSKEKQKNRNAVIFKDTGPGIPKDNLRHIFDRFYTKTEHGTGIGLAFCQSVIQGFGGEITCRSQEGEHTTFIISLPLLEAGQGETTPQQATKTQPSGVNEA